MNPVDLAVLALYFVAVALIGLRFRSTQRSSEDYFLAGRQLPGWVVSFSLIGTMIGSTSFIGQPASVYQENMWYAPTFLTLPLVMVVVARWVVPLYRRQLGLSVYGYLERRFGGFGRGYGALAFLLSRVVDIGATLFFLGLAASTLTGLELGTVVLLTGGLTVGYSLVGGFAAIAWAEVLQSLLLFTGMAIVLLTAVLGAEQGGGEVLGAAWEAGKFRMGDWNLAISGPEAERNGWILVLGGAVWALQRYAVDQHLVQRYLSARTDREASRAAFVGAVSCVPIWLAFMLLGALIYGYYAVRGEFPGSEVSSNDIVPRFVLEECPPGVLGIIVAALAAAAMSSLAADLNSVATVVVDDFSRRFKPDAPDRVHVAIGRGVVVLAGAASIGLSLAWQGVESAVEFTVQLLLVATSGMIGLFALGLLTRRATAAGAYLGIAATVAFTAWGTLTAVPFALEGGQRPLVDLGSLNFPLSPLFVGIGGHLVLFSVGLLGSLLIGTPPEDVDELVL